MLLFFTIAATILFQLGLCLLGFYANRLYGKHWDCLFTYPPG